MDRLTDGWMDELTDRDIYIHRQTGKEISRQKNIKANK